jgi:Lon protease-like protein
MSKAGENTGLLVDPAELPRVIPIFPLPGALLLPQGRLPLNIFEPRYLNMVRDAFKSDGLIGMIQTAEALDARPEPKLYRTGCLGRITSKKDEADGRILITLTGLCRFDVVEELFHVTPYRKVAVDYTRFLDDCDAGADHSVVRRQVFVDHVKAYLAARGLSSDWKTVDQVPDDALVNSLAMICPFEPAEKQALLEAETVGRRADIMNTIIDFALAQAEMPPQKQ